MFAPNVEAFHLLVNILSPFPQIHNFLSFFKNRETSAPLVLFVTIMFGLFVPSSHQCSSMFFQGVTAMLVVRWVGGWRGRSGGREVKASLFTPHKIAVFDSAFSRGVKRKCVPAALAALCFLWEDHLLATRLIENDTQTRISVQKAQWIGECLRTSRFKVQQNRPS